MIRLIFAVCFAGLLPLNMAFAEAPVVDQSENYAMLDDQEAATEQPLVKARSRNKYDDEETPLVQEEDPNTSEEMDPLTKIKEMQQEIRELRGQIEVQAHELSLLKNQQLSFYKDIDTY